VIHEVQDAGNKTRIKAMTTDWTGTGKVRAREMADCVEITIDGLTTQAKYYKPLIYEFMRKEWSSRPSWGDYVVEIAMEHVGEPPTLDLDNLAKAVLDAIKGYLFHDDAQVSRLLVERFEGERERITIRCHPRTSRLRAEDAVAGRTGPWRQE